MIPQKDSRYPAPKYKTLFLSPSYLKNSDRAAGYAFRQLKEEKDTLVLAEGGERFHSVGMSITALYCAGERLFCRKTGGLLVLPDDRNFAFNEDLCGVLLYRPPEEDPVCLLLGSEHVYVYSDISFMASDAPGGSGFAVHHERLFVGKGKTLRYSKPLDTEKWELTEDGAGEIELSEEGGDILALFSFGGDLMCFRSRKILRVRAGANDLNFRVEEIPFDGGEILAGTVCDCGSAIVFATSRGLVKYRKGSCEFVFTDAVFSGTAGSSAGLYYIPAQSEGKNCILCYDLGLGKTRLLNADAEVIAGGTEGVYYGHGSVIYRITPCGTHPMGLGGKMQASIRVGTGGRTAEGLSAEGSGDFTVTLTTEEESVQLRLSAGSYTRLERPLRGAFFDLTVEFSDPAASFGGIRMYFREDV